VVPRATPREVHGAAGPFLGADALPAVTPGSTAVRRQTSRIGSDDPSTPGAPRDMLPARWSGLPPARLRADLHQRWCEGARQRLNGAGREARHGLTVLAQRLASARPAAEGDRCDPARPGKHECNTNLAFLFLSAASVPTAPAPMGSARLTGPVNTDVTRT
jgi:hypothetical protein